MATIYRYDRTQERESDFQDWECGICKDNDPTKENGTCIHGEEKRHIFHINCLIQWLAKQTLCPTCRVLVDKPRSIEQIQPFAKDANLNFQERAIQVVERVCTLIPRFILVTGLCAKSSYLVMVGALADSSNGYSDKKSLEARLMIQERFMTDLQGYLAHIDQIPRDRLTPEQAGLRQHYQSLLVQLEKSVNDHRISAHNESFRIAAMGALAVASAVQWVKGK